LKPVSEEGVDGTRGVEQCEKSRGIRDGGCRYSDKKTTGGEERSTKKRDSFRKEGRKRRTKIEGKQVKRRRNEKTGEAPRLLCRSGC